MNLSRALRLIRVTDGIGLREMAKEIGISAPTLSRIERGYDCDIRSFDRLMSWLIATPKKKVA